MATTTLFCQWRNTTVSRSRIKLIQAIRTFLTASGWTVVDDQSSGATAPYIVVTRNRATGFTGDNLLVRIRARLDNATERLSLRTYSSWNAVTHVGTNQEFLTGSEERLRSVMVSYNTNMDLYVSCDSTFIVIHSSVADPTFSSPLIGVLSMTRKVGDIDLGTFYGGWALKEPTKLWVPTFMGMNVGERGFFNCSTILGGTTSPGTAGASGDQVLSLRCTIAGLGKYKERLEGIRVTTNSALVTAGTIVPSIDGTDWRVVKSGTQSWMFPYATPTLNT